MKFKFGAAPLIPLAAIVIGIVFAYMGFKHYGYWHPKRGPQPGFYPSLAGIGLALTGIVGMLKAFKEKAADLNLRDWYVALSVVLIIALSYVIGMLPTLVVYVLIWLRLVQKTTWKTVLIVLVAVSAMVYGVFILWLQVLFETGIIYKTLCPAY